MNGMRRVRGSFGVIAIASLMFAGAAAQTKRYEPTLESLNTHPLPQWYADAKLGIFIHWEIGRAHV